MVLVNSAGIAPQGRAARDMFVCSEMTCEANSRHGGGDAEWLKGWRATTEMENTSTTATALPARSTRGRPALCNPKLDRWLHRS